jgi:hypothetical protein
MNQILVKLQMQKLNQHNKAKKLFKKIKIYFFDEIQPNTNNEKMNEK